MEPEKISFAPASVKHDAVEINQSTSSAQPTEAASNSESHGGNGATNSVKENVSEYRTFAVLGYILPFLYFLPLLDDKTKNVPYVRFHANQQLILLIMVGAIYFIYDFFYLFILPLMFIVKFFNLVFLILMVIGAHNAYMDKKEELPVIGKLRILR